MIPILEEARFEIGFIDIINTSFIIKTPFDIPLTKSAVPSPMISDSIVISDILR